METQIKQKRKEGSKRRQQEEKRKAQKKKKQAREAKEVKPAFVIQKDKHFTAQLDCVKNTCVLIVRLQAFKTSVYLSQ